MSPKAPSRSGKKIAVIYHADCPDGFGAAWAAWKKFGKKADYYPLSHSDTAPALRGKIVYLLDFMFDTAAPLKVLQKANKQVTAIDHHSSNKNLITSTVDYRYSLFNSGAVLAWQYFHPERSVPAWLKYIEDYDIWTKKLRGVDEMNAFLLLQAYDFKVWDKLVRDFEKPIFRKQVIAQGKVIKAYENHIARKVIASSAIPVRFLGHMVYAINFNGPKTLANEISQLLIKKQPPFSILWKEKRSGVHVSLRGNGTIDLTKFVQKFGGGGRADTCAFKISLKKGLPWKELSHEL